MLMIKRKTRQNTGTDEYEHARHLRIGAVMTCVLVLAGCAQQQQKTDAGHVSASDVGTAEAMDVAEDVLAKLREFGSCQVRNDARKKLIEIRQCTTISEQEVKSRIYQFS